MRVGRPDDRWRYILSQFAAHPRKLKVEEESAAGNELARSAAFAAWTGQDSFGQNGVPSPANRADRVDPAGSRRQPVAPSQDRADPFRRRWLDMLLDTNMDRSGVGRPVKTGPQPIKPIARGLLDALREALEDQDVYVDPLRGPAI